MMKRRKQQEPLLPEDIELIRKRLQQLDDSINLPYVLRAENLRERINKEDRKRFREAAYGDFRSWQRLAVTAAAVVLVVTAYVGVSQTGLTFFDKSSGAPAPQEASSAERYGVAQDYLDEALPQTQLYAQDYNQIYAELTEALNRSTPPAYGGGIVGKLDGGEEMMGIQSVEPEEGAQGDISISIISQTVAPLTANNLDWVEQERSDLAVTDGKYLYYYRPANHLLPKNSVYIIEADSMTIASRIELESNNGVGLQLAGNKLALTVRQNGLEGEPLYTAAVQRSLSQVESGQMNLEASDIAPIDGVTSLLVYDISDPTAPVFERRLEQDGNYAVSAVSGSVAYLVTTKSLYSDLVQQSDPLLCNLVPVVRDSAVGSSQALPASNIVVTSSNTSASYTVVSAVDLSAPQAPVATKAVLGGEGMYMSLNNLYVYHSTYAQDGRTPVTNLVRMALRGGEVEVRAQGQVEGTLRSTQSLDEKDGLLRIATTSVNPDTQMTSNNLYVLDSKLELTGSIEGLAPGEEIVSARYLGNMVYIVTQNQTEPIFAVDVSDPQNPLIIGQLDLPGIAQNLIPVGETAFAGLETNTHQRQDGEVVTSGLRVSLYDLSTPHAPKQKDALVLPGAQSHSVALDNAKAVLYVPEKQIIGLPLLSRAGENGRLLSWGYVLLELDEQEANLIGTVTHADRMDEGYISSHYQDIQRGLVIGDTLYTFSNSKVMATPIDNLRQNVTLVLD